MTSSPPKVSVALLSYNRPEFLREALASLAAQTLRPHELLVIDNCSPRAAEIAKAVANCPQARLIVSARNLGFAAGMNVGLRIADGDFILLTEDDIVLAPDALEKLVARAAASHCIVGPMLLNRREGTVRCAGGHVRLGTRLEFELFGSGAPDDGRFDQPRAVEFLPGAILCARREIWNRIEGFREEYFLYFEDVELCVRANSLGIDLEYLPNARVRHFEPTGDAPPDWLNALKVLNFLRTYLLLAPSEVLPMFMARYFLWSPVKDLARGRRSGWHSIRALFSILPELPSLLRQRRANFRSARLSRKKISEC
jgi:GT2 family glycosyltransferase